ncbi:MAG: hypothetical protein ACRENI_14860 [Gemmatimonadaceae bacterium]
MTGHDDDDAKHPESREQPERDGFGDDQGTRVGAPDPHANADEAMHGISATRPVSNAMRASGKAGSSTGSTSKAGGRPTGSGAEAAEGIHNKGRAAANRERKQEARHGVDAGRDQPNETPPTQVGSEPLEERNTEHKSGYGGEGGKPKTSSDERPPGE